MIEQEAGEQLQKVEPTRAIEVADNVAVNARRSVLHSRAALMAPLLGIALMGAACVDVGPPSTGSAVQTPAASGVGGSAVESPKPSPSVSPSPRLGPESPRPSPSASPQPAEGGLSKEQLIQQEKDKIIGEADAQKQAELEARRQAEADRQKEFDQARKAQQDAQAGQNGGQPGSGENKPVVIIQDKKKDEGPNWLALILGTAAAAYAASQAWRIIRPIWRWLRRSISRGRGGPSGGGGASTGGGSAMGRLTP